MKIQVRNRCSDYKSYRAARVKSLFNCAEGCNFDHDADLGIDDGAWKLGVVVGPSGSGKTSIGKLLFPDTPGAFYNPAGAWPDDAPIVDAIAPNGDFDAVTAALAAVGLGDVPAWLRPYSVLSNGEKFRADMARIVSEAPAQVVVDEFTSVVDRQIAKIGSMAFSKAWKRTPGKAVLLSCHYDILDWLEPDWVYDTATRQFARGSLWRRPKFDLEVRETDWSYWPLFEPHHYLKLPKMVASVNYVGFVNDAPVCHVAFAPRQGVIEARACRLVVLPEWQGAGVGMRFLNSLCEMWLKGDNRFKRPLRTLFHTSHPGLCAAIRRDARWTQVSAVMHGSNKARSRDSINRSAAKNKWQQPPRAGYGGHLRAIQGFRYLGEAHAAAKKAQAPTQKVEPKK